MEKLINCKTCGPRPQLDFNTHKKRGFQSQCKTCRSEYTKQHYKQNKKDYINRAKKRNDIARDNNRRNIIEYLKIHPCEICGEKDIVVLDFHHRNPKQKDFNISAVTGWISWKKIEKEIKKCIVLCANDHRREHAKENKTYRYTGRSG